MSEQTKVMPVELDGKMWSKVRAAFYIYACRFNNAKTNAESSIVADIAPAEIWKEAVAAAPQPTSAEGETLETARLALKCQGEIVYDKIKRVEDENYALRKELEAAKKLSSQRSDGWDAALARAEKAEATNKYAGHDIIHWHSRCEKAEAALAEALARIQTYNENIEYLLSTTVGAVRVREGGGPEDLIGSLCTNYIALRDEAGRAQPLARIEEGRK